jgi:DtxR family Mn-dependent transcriptional regulator
MLSPKVEDYLKTIYRLEREVEGAVSTSRLAEAMDVTSPTATSMMETLAEREFVEREKYKGVRLTPEGETVALEVVRHHRLLETFLAEHLGYDWAEVHDEADRLEHHISEEFERRVAAALEDPTVDPHGDPIPSADLDPVDEGRPTLAECDEGATVRIERVRDGEPDVLNYLSEAGVRPGTQLTVTEIAPFGMVTAEVNREPVSLPAEVARLVHVTGVDVAESVEGAA